jgi:hypothetical protein
MTIASLYGVRAWLRPLSYGHSPIPHLVDVSIPPSPQPRLDES